MTTTTPSSLLDTRNRAYATAVPHDIAGLYTGFHTAVTILRIARALGELDDDDAGDNGATMDGFFQRLATVEEHLFRRNSQKKNRPFVVVVEGLDGSGKSTLVERLVGSFPKSIKAETPPTRSTSAAVRNVFDKRGGAVARAFYMVSNYMLQEEIRESSSSSCQLVVVDRWYSSTCAYSIGYKNTSGGPETIDCLGEALFQWPTHDLDPPDLLLILQVNDKVRRERVQGRGAIDNDNPWDDRLANDTNLGQRIQRAFERITGPREVILLNANRGKEEVGQEAEEMVRERLLRHVKPWDFYRQAPLGYFRWTCAGLNLCDLNSGRRLKHTPWAFQLAMNASKGTPSLRSVGIHTAEDEAILFFTWGHPGGARGGDDNNNRSLASMVWVGGDYPNEQQWRAEGILCSTTLAECQLMGTEPPASLVAQVAACREEAHQGTRPDETKRQLQPGSHMDTVAKQRESPPPIKENEVLPTRFVPLRVEVLMGGPSSPGGPRRFEWSREKGSNEWTKAREILPFSPPTQLLCPIPRQSPLPVTVAIMGTHCSGKRTLGGRLASVLGWKFQNELGEILRDEEDVVADAHKQGYTSSASAMSWDDTIHHAEIDRDETSHFSRVVETWHVGNLAWALMRVKTGASTESSEASLVARARAALEQELQKSSVLLVQVQASPEASLLRRHKDPANAARVPMTNEASECQNLYAALEERGCELAEEFHRSSLNIPLLQVDNSADGESVIEESLKSIVSFINQHHWRRAL